MLKYSLLHCVRYMAHAFATICELSNGKVAYAVSI